MQEGSKIYLMAPIERKGQDSFEDIFNEIRSAGYLRVRIDGKLYTLENIPEIDHRRKHNVEVVIDRLVIKSGMRTRICDAVESGLDLGKGMLHVAHVDDQFAEETWKIDKYSQHFSCTKCNRGFEPLNPHHFSFNSPLGWCPVCEGLGKQQGANPALLVRNPSLTLRKGALSAWPDLEANDGFLPLRRPLPMQEDLILILLLISLHIPSNDWSSMVQMKTGLKQRFLLQPKTIPRFFSNTRASSLLLKKPLE